jgi:hypothetical protein
MRVEAGQQQAEQDEQPTDPAPGQKALIAQLNAEPARQSQAHRQSFVCPKPTARRSRLSTERTPVPIEGRKNGGALSSLALSLSCRCMRRRGGRRCSTSPLARPGLGPERGADDLDGIRPGAALSEVHRIQALLIFLLRLSASVQK